MNKAIQQNATLLTLNLEEKVKLLSGADEWTTKAINDSLPPVWVADGPHGLRKSPNSTTGGYGDQFPATCFPTASALAATWNTNLIKEVGQYLAQECKAHEVDVLLGPGVNIKRSPCGGRNFEYFSEDPILAGQLGAAYINGLQENNVGTSLKHFAANSQETNRMVVSSDMDERTLRETYLAPFEIAVKQAQPWTVMASYNPINGIDGTSHHQLLVDILREEWRYEGCVVSDWVAVHDRIQGVKNGLNLQMPGNGGVDDQKVLEALRDGTLTETDIDACLEHTLNFIEKAVAHRKTSHNFNAKKSHQFARNVAGECIVLLKNDDQTLPINQSKKTNIALIGEFAKFPRTQGNGSSEVKPTQLDTLHDELSKLADNALTINYEQGYCTNTDSNAKYIEAAVELARQSDMAILNIGLPNSYESEGVDRDHIDLPPSQLELVDRVVEVQPKTIVVLTNGSAVSMPWLNKVPAILETWLTGQAGASAIADVLVGNVNPSGKLAETFPVRYEDTPAFLDLPSQSRSLKFSEGIFVGYKWYDKRKIEPLFPFGHGLSYTTFAFHPITLSSQCITDSENITVSLSIENIGQYDGAEVVQLYISGPTSSRVTRPVKELKGFTKTEIKRNSSALATIHLTPRDFAYFDEEYNQWVVESGVYTLHAGSSATDIRQSQTVTVVSHQRLPVHFDRKTTLKEWVSIPETKDLAYNLVKTFFDPIPELYDGDLYDFKIHNGFFLDMPLAKYDGLSRGAIKLSDIDAAIAKTNTLTFGV